MATHLRRFGRRKAGEGPPLERSEWFVWVWVAFAVAVIGLTVIGLWLAAAP